MILLDSNVWVYYLDASLREHARVKSRFASLTASDDVLMPTIVQLEVLHYLTRRLRDESQPFVDVFLGFPCEIEALDGGLVRQAAKLLTERQASGIGARDAAILATAQRRDATLATADKALTLAARREGVAVVNPAR